MIVLTDANGTILHSVGDSDFLERARKVALAPGVNWAEHAKGTNAIGTALFEEAPTRVHGGEHFMHANQFLTCSAAPIFDPRGEILGVLDVSGDQRSFHQHTMGLVRVSARMIENHWLSDDCSDRVRLHFHSRPEFIGTLLEGIVVVGDGGRILGANRSALDQLGVSGAALRGQTLTSLFETTIAAVTDHFRAPLPLPLRVRTPGGAQFHLQARANWGARPHLARGGTLPTPAADAAAPIHPSGAAPVLGLSFLQSGDARIDAIVRKLRRVVDRGIPLLLIGETGTGKELTARAVHQDSHRAKQAFVAVNCATLAPDAIEAELFGSSEAVPGEWRKAAPGRIVQASGGTLFLDDIGAMAPALQARLLRVLQQRCVTPLGSLRAIPVDVAIICAHQRPLRESIERGLFREDLYHRLNGLTVQLPALRERTDLAALARRILQAECAGAAPVISADVMAMFGRHPWPGNIRQLANVLRAAALMADGEVQITEQHLEDDFLADLHRPGAWPAAGAAVQATTMEAAQIDVVLDTLAQVQGNISEASKRLGVSRNTIYRKLRKARRPGPSG
jgi:transcriptional regulator of acetoin/glycerol metabolism